MELTFWGAARQVTGSMFLLELPDDFKILIDCGTDMRREYNDPNFAEMFHNPGSLFSFEPSQINLVLLTHAHIDHSGNLPNLVREGFEGQILCTGPTLALAELLLMDSAMLHRKRINALVAQKKDKRNGHKPNFDLRELFTEVQAEESLERFVTIPFLKRFKINKTAWVTFIPTGHLLGAANILLEVEQDGKLTKIGFSGDLGRYNYPLLNDPHPFPEVDYLICESTYGNRDHVSKGNPTDIMADIIKEACIDMPGRLIIPSFSVGRTQALLYTLNRLYAERDFPPIKIFADSPLALQSTQVYEKYIKFLNQEAQNFQRENGELFDFENLHYVENIKQSKAVSNYNEPCIIISSSGMVSGGRVEHHVRANIGNPYCTILMVGYAAEGTLGYELMQGAKTITFGGKEMYVSAKVRRTDIFSGHADRTDLMRFVKQQNPERLKSVFLVHGEGSSMDDFRLSLIHEGFENVAIPAKGDHFVLD